MHGDSTALAGDGDAWDFLVESVMLDALRYHLLHNVDYFTQTRRESPPPVPADAFSPAVTFVAGGAGAGKTRFLQELSRVFTEELMDLPVEEGGEVPFTDHMALWCNCEKLDGSGSTSVDEMVGASTLASVDPVLKNAKGRHSLERSIAAMRGKMLIPPTVPPRRIAVLLLIDVLTTCRYTLPALHEAIQQYGEYVTKSDYFIFPVSTLTCNADVVASIQLRAFARLAPWTLAVLPKLCRVILPPTISGDPALPVALPPGVFEAMKGHPVAIGYLYLVVQKDPTASPLAWLTRVKLLLLARYRPELAHSSSGTTAAVEL